MKKALVAFVLAALAAGCGGVPTCKDAVEVYLKPTAPSHLKGRCAGDSKTYTLVEADGPATIYVRGCPEGKVPGYTAEGAVACVEGE